MLTDSMLTHLAKISSTTTSNTNVNTNLWKLLS